MAVPLVDDHPLMIEDKDNLPATMTINFNPVLPKSKLGSRYSELVPTWGFETSIGDAAYPSQEEEDDVEDETVMSSSREPSKALECKLCAKLEVPFAVRSPERLEDHMKYK